MTVKCDKCEEAKSLKRKYLQFFQESLIMRDKICGKQNS